MDNHVLSELKNKFDEEENFRLKEKKAKEFNYYEVHGFKSWEELLSYIKTGKTAYNYNDTLSWNHRTNLIRYHHQTSDGSDCNFWYTNNYFTEEEFLSWKHDVDNRYPENARNEYGYINGWSK